MTGFDPVRDVEIPRSNGRALAGEGGLRVGAIYLVGYLLPWPLVHVPIIGPRLDELFHSLWSAVATALHIEPLQGWLNGTTTEEIAKVLVSASVALVLGAAWMLQQPAPNPWFRRWGEAVMRIALASALVHYGLNKIPPAQFSRPTLQRLEQPVGELNMMELFWTFVGASPVYTMFGGFLELIAAALLCVRKMRLAGALLAFAVLLNVAMLNFCYDVVTKLYTSHLLIIAFALSAGHAPRLLRFFTGQAVTPDESAPVVDSLRARSTVTAITAAWLVITCAYTAYGINRSYHQMGNARRRPALYGIYQVDRLFEDGRERPPLRSDRERWRLLIIDRALPMDLGEWGVSPGEVWVVKMNGARERRFVALDGEGHRISFLSGTGDSAGASEHLTLRQEEDGWRATGKIGGHDVEMFLTRKDHTEMPLFQPTQFFDL